MKTTLDLGQFLSSFSSELIFFALLTFTLIYFLLSLKTTNQNSFKSNVDIIADLLSQISTLEKDLYEARNQIKILYEQNIKLLNELKKAQEKINHLELFITKLQKNKI